MKKQLTSITRAKRRVKSKKMSSFPPSLSLRESSVMNECSSISKDVKLGKNVKIYGFTNLYGCEIGDNTKIGAFVEIQKGVKIGKNCKISSHTFICEGATLEDNVFIGHNVSFINDKYPRAARNGKLQTENDWKVIPILVKKGASIGTSATIMCGITIGENAFVGAGCLVIDDVPDNTTVYDRRFKVVKKNKK